MDNLPDREAFADQINTTFEAKSEAGANFEVKLVEVKSIVSNKIQECFALLFSASADDAPTFQQLFQLKHADLGEMEIFLVPVKKNENELFFEAVFNKLLA